VAQQYVIAYDGSNLYWQVNNWKIDPNSSNALTLIINDWADLVGVSGHKVPAGWRLIISLANDGDGNITGATFSVVDPKGNNPGKHSISIGKKNQAPIMAFEMVLIGPGNSRECHPLFRRRSVPIPRVQRSQCFAQYPYWLRRVKPDPGVGEHAVRIDQRGSEQCAYAELFPGSGGSVTGSARLRSKSSTPHSGPEVDHRIPRLLPGADRFSGYAIIANALSEHCGPRIFQFRGSGRLTAHQSSVDRSGSGTARHRN
jgi:hypothetical protein